MLFFALWDTVNQWKGDRKELLSASSCRTSHVSALWQSSLTSRKRVHQLKIHEEVKDWMNQTLNLKNHQECLRIWSTAFLGFLVLITRKSLSGLRPDSSGYMLKSQQISPLGNLIPSVCTYILKLNHLWPFFLHFRVCCCAHHIQTCCNNKGPCVQSFNTLSSWLLERSWGLAFFEAGRRWHGNKWVTNSERRTGWNWEELGINACLFGPLVPFNSPFCSSAFWSSSNIIVVWPCLDARHTPKPLCHSSAGQGRENIAKGSWVEMRTGRDHLPNTIMGKADSAEGC